MTLRRFPPIGNNNPDSPGCRSAEKAIRTVHKTRREMKVRKLVHSIAAVLPLLALCTACSEDNETEPSPVVLEVDGPRTILFAADGTSDAAHVAVMCSSAWDVHLDPADGNGWLSLGEKSDDSFTLVAQPNTETVAPDEVEIIVSAEGAVPVKLVAQQEAVAAVSQKTDIRIEGVADGEAFTVYFTNNISREGVLTDGVLAVEGLTGDVRTIYLIRSECTGDVLIGRRQDQTVALAFGDDGSLIWRTDAEGRRLVNSVAELMAIDTDAASRAGNYRQECDLDLLGNAAFVGQPVAQRLNWTPVGSDDSFEPKAQYITPDGQAVFQGRYDGGGYRIANLWVSRKNNAGLFGCVGPQGTVENLIIASATIECELNQGAVCGVNFGSVAQCLNEAPLTLGARSGGICGRNDHEGTLRDCANEASLTGNGLLGGICGVNFGRMEGCTNSGKITSRSGEGATYTGGVCGDSYGCMADCHNSGDVTGYRGVGGVAGQSSGFGGDKEVTLTACSNIGTVRGIDENEQSQDVGGVVGANVVSRLATSFNAGRVTGTAYVGGVCGFNSDASIIASYNTGDIEALGWAGGVVGYIGSKTVTTSIVRACYNIGRLTTAELAGGICSESYGTIEGCYFLRYDAADQGVEVIGTVKGETAPTETFAFDETNWPSASDMGWGVGDVAAEGIYWQSLGGWSAAGTPAGASSDFPILWWEK